MTSTLTLKILLSRARYTLIQVETTDLELNVFLFSQAIFCLKQDQTQFEHKQFLNIIYTVYIKRMNSGTHPKYAVKHLHDKLIFGQFSLFCAAEMPTCEILNQLKRF